MYQLAFFICVTLTILLTLRAHSGTQTQARCSDFESFKWKYLCVYFLAMTSDWLQGPYVYALYDAYGFSQSDIAKLFVAGFGSSFLFGTFVGSLADQYGRKKWALLYTVVYSVSCITKHFADYWILMAGRICGGIATSLLFSVFDSWMVKEHNDRNFAPEWMENTFSLAMFGNSIVAIVSGVIAQQAADAVEMKEVFFPSFMIGGYCTPFDLSLVLLIATSFVISMTWTENYGNSNSSSFYSFSAITSSIGAIFSDPKIFLAGSVQSLFEGSMYTFVFIWTPALKSIETEVPPYGLIFATMMVCCMAGSSLFSIVIRRINTQSVLSLALILSAISLTLPIFFPEATYIGFLIFEVCVGLYFPAMGTLKSQVVPEDKRAGVYNLFRVPLNLIVLYVLFTDLQVKGTLVRCVIMLVLGSIASFQLQSKLGQRKYAGIKSSTLEDENL